MGSLENLSPFANYVGSFFDPAARIELILLFATALGWVFFSSLPVGTIRYLDRKLRADMQMRIGPNRTGPWGLFQALADSTKLFFKAERLPITREAWLFRAAPFLALSFGFVAVTCVPFAQHWTLFESDSSLVILIGSALMSKVFLNWASLSGDDPWARLSSFRSLALIGVGLTGLIVSILPPIIQTGSLNVRLIAELQGGAPWTWMLFRDPGNFLAFFVFNISMLIWSESAPFDHATAEFELARGASAEYSGISKLMVERYRYIVIYLWLSTSVAVFLGGGNVPIDLSSIGRAASLVQFLVFQSKVLFLAVVTVFARGALPRLKLDQVLYFGWHILVPAGISSVLLSAVWCFGLTWFE